MALSSILDLEKVDKLFHAKLLYGQLFCFNVQNYTIVFRPLAIGELEAMESLSSKLSLVAVEDWIVKTTFITSTHSIDHILNYTRAQFVSSLASKIAQLSTIREEKDYKKTIMLKREGCTRMQDLVESIIIKAFPAYTQENIKSMTQEKQFELLVRAEESTGVKVDLGNKAVTKKALRQATQGVSVLGGTEDITSPLVADKPDFNEAF